VSEDILDLPTPPADARIPYGSGALSFGDLRLPAGAGPHPVALVLHGGYWRARYDLEHIGHVCAALTGAGLATWSVEYRRLGNPGGGWPGTFLDVAAGADYLRALAGSYPLDLERVVAVGHSAGGQLAAWLAGRRNIPPADSPLHSDDPLPLRGVVALAGVLDLRRAYELRLSRGVTGELMGGSPKEHPDRYAAASPAALLPLGVRQILLHGDADDSVPYVISRDYAEAACAAGDPVELVTLPGAGHFELIDPRSAEWPLVERAVLSLAE
jgi:acetyl esterase/lipase